MKILPHASFLVIVLLFSCNSQKNASQENNLKNELKCPKDGVCTFEVLKNKTFLIKSKFGDTYPEFSDGNKTILKFEYIRNSIPNTEDSGYRELVYVEIDANSSELELEGKALKIAKVSFGRLCFCRGQTGYYNVDQGKLSITKNENGSHTFELDFKVNEVPQIIMSIRETFNL